MDCEPVVNALSFDIEDWFHLVEVKAVDDPRLWETFPSLVERATDWILATLEVRRTRATFFIVGWIAERYPRLVRQIAEAGHELGLHTYWHRRCDQQSPAVLAAELRRNKEIVEQQAGRRVLGFRAPSFSITPGSEWVFDVLHDLGIAYDSSLFPATRAHGGFPCRQEPHWFEAVPSGRPMLELPISVLKFGPVKIPFSGGGYLRLLPSSVIRYGFQHFARRGLPVVVYLHPRDFCPDCPRVAMPWQRRFKSYVGLKTTQIKLATLLDEHRFTTCADVLGLDANGDAIRDPALSGAVMSRRAA